MDVTDCNEAEAKEIDADNIKSNNIENEDVKIQCLDNETLIDYDLNNQDITKEFGKDDLISIPIEKTYEKFLVKLENEEKEQEKSLDDFNAIEEVGEDSTGNNEDLEINNIVNDNNASEIKEIEIIPETIDDEDNMQDEELDHEVDDEEIKCSNNDFNQSNDTVGVI